MQNLIDNAVGSKNAMQFNFLVYLRVDSGEYLHKRVLYIRLEFAKVFTIFGESTYKST